MDFEEQEERKTQLEVPEVDRVKYEITQEIQRHIESACAILRTALVQGEKKDFVEELLAIWTDNDGSRKDAKPRFYVRAGDVEIKVVFDGGNEYDSASRTVMLDISHLRTAKTIEELDEAFVSILESLYHEVEHVYNPGVELDDEDVGGVIAYLCNDGEISAHARQFAFRYLQEYPGVQFEPERMTALAEHLGSAKMHNYFIAFADPQKQIMYRQFADLEMIHQKMMTETMRQHAILSVLIQSRVSINS